MSEWSVLTIRTAPDSTSRIEASAEEVLDHLFDLQEELSGFGPSVSIDDATISIRAAYQAGDPAEAARGVLEITGKALRNLVPLVATWRVTHIEVTEWSQFEKDLETPNVPPLVGVAELASMLGVSRQRASELARVEHFPKPLVELASGPVWLKPNVTDFVANWNRSPGRPRKVAG